MLKEVDWANDGTYRPGTRFSPERFFNDGLKNSLCFDLQLGYFSSATISVLADGFATFISRGGTMRLVINQIVSAEDKQTIADGMAGQVINCMDLTDFEKLRKTFDEYQEQFFKCLAYLIAQKRIEIRIICPKGKTGIAHTKSGQFRDGDSTTSFTGSANFTINGLFNNIEEIKIDRSDSPDPMTRNRIASQRVAFEAIMNGTRNDIEYLSPDDLETAIHSCYHDPGIDELLDTEKQLERLRKMRRNYHASDTPLPSLGEGCTNSYGNAPHFPFPTGPRDYQKQAFSNWKGNGQKGLFVMATGTGKTLTALNCLLEIYQRKGYYKAIILVPTQTLVEQWKEECRKFGFQNVVLAYSKNPKWKEEVELLHLKEEFNPLKNAISYVIISTYASYARGPVFESLNTFSKNQTLLIADEAHNMGAQRIQERMENIRYLRRIGLSATPSRQFDDVGNQKLLDFFGCTEGYTFEYTMKEAIDHGFLCRYDYYPHVVKLEEDEMAEYLKISRQLCKFYNARNDAFTGSNDVMMALLLKRKRLIHKARQKETVFKEILRKRFEEKGNLKYTLVYVPEGNKPDSTADIFDAKDEMSNDLYTEHLIDRYTQIVCDISRTTTVREYTSESAERQKMLHDFAQGTLEVLTSMKCLDEGVDVPRSEMAIFCASTGNPRQFVQRRGRILRNHKDKHRAVIHDLIVAPCIGSHEGCFKMERNMLAAELKRVKDFASLSENADFTYQELEDITAYYNLPIL